MTPDNQVQSSVNLFHIRDRDQDFAYLVQIQDRDGITASLTSYEYQDIVFDFIIIIILSW